jgi:uncharacterized protein (TIGR02246 family)
LNSTQGRVGAMARSMAVVALVVCAMLAAAHVASSRSDVKDEIRASVQKYADAVSAKDLDGCMDMFASEHEPVMMGTGPGELWVGKEQIADAHTHFFEGFAREKNETSWRQMDVEGDVAWGGAAYVVTQHVGEVENQFHLHLTVVMVKEEGKWLFALIHFSNLTGPDQQPAEAGS